MHRPAASHPRPAFTLIELLIVIGIITILISVALVVGQKVTSSGKQRVTEGMIKTLDTSLSEYIHARGHNPPEWVVDPRDPTHVYMLPVADVALVNPRPPLRPGEPPRINNSLGLYLLQCRAVPEADAVLKELNPRYLRMYDPDTDPATGNPGPPDSRPPLLTVFDGWGRPIRYVHPTFQGIIGVSSGSVTPVDPARITALPPGNPQKQSTLSTITRTGQVDVNTPFPPPDADAGIPLNNRPYFYSLGADGKAGYEYDPSQYKRVTDFNKDNVFTVVPRYVE